MVKLYSHYYRERMTCVYTTKEEYEQFLSKKLLGLKVIKLKGSIMENATKIIDFNEHGVIEAQASYYDLDGTQRITLKLK